jgi:hypothetical protein
VRSTRTGSGVRLRRTVADRRLTRTVACVAALTALASCGSSDDEVTDVCGDLRSFGATFELLLQPQADATVGEVRGALEKVAPFLGRVAGVDATPESLDDEIAAVEETFRDGLEDLGDDEPSSRVDDRLGGERPRLENVLAQAAAVLGCEAGRA